MAEHDDLLLAGLVFGGGERPAERRPHAEARRSKLAVTRAPVTRSAAPSLVRLKLEYWAAASAVEGRRRRAHVGEVARGHAARPAAVVLVDVDQPLGRGIRQRLQDDGVHRAEDRRRRADADRERQQRDERESGLGDEMPERERDVLAELRPVFRSTHVVVLLPARALRQAAD